MTLPDGRPLAYEAMVDRAGFPVVVLHGTPGPSRQLAGLAVPAHIWHGSQDRNVPVAHARVIVARCPAAQLHIVDGGGHLLLSQLGPIIASVTSRPSGG